MKNQSTFSGWDFDTVWAMDSGRNDGYPYLQWAEDLFEEAGGSGGGCNAGAMNSTSFIASASRFAVEEVQVGSRIKQARVSQGTLYRGSLLHFRSVTIR